MKKILFALSLMLASVAAQAQGVWGETAADSVSCNDNFNIFGSYYQSKNYVDAFEPWYALYSTCPAAKELTYKWGPKIIEAKIKATEDEAEKVRLAKILVQQYDDRLKYFPGDEGDVLADKATDYYKYNKDSIEQASLLFDEAYAVAGKNMSPTQLQSFFIVKIKMFNIDKDIDALFLSYNRAIEALEFNSMEYSNMVSTLSAKMDSIELDDKEARNLDRSTKILKNYDIVQRNIEKALSPLLSCEKLSLIYNEEKFEANRDNVEWLARAAKMLQAERQDDEGNVENCTDNPVFILIAERLYELEPSAQSARSMARLGIKQENWELAKKYFNEALEQEEDLRKKSDDYMGLAYANQRLHQLSAAKSNCLKAAQLRKDWGNPYLFLATVYAEAAGTCGSNAVEKNAVYWAAINKLNYAKSIDPSLASKANTLINAYSAAVPDKGVAFQLGFKEGDQINIGCWINETVTIKFY